MRWIVRPGDGPTVGEVLARAGADGRAVAEGRVFVGRRRVKGEDEPIAPDDVVEVAASRETSGKVQVLARTRDLVAVDKPPGVPTIPDHGGGAHALVAMTARALGLDAADLHPTSRLDRDVSGVVVFALTRAANARLADARARGAYARRYVAIAAHAPAPVRGEWKGAIGRASDPRLRTVGGRDAFDAVTRYRVCAQAAGGAALLAASPVTGRTHQIRVHAAHAGAALLGDRSYGGPVRLTLPSGRVLAFGRIALHAAVVTVPDEGGAPMTVTSAVPEPLRSWWQALGGAEGDWEGCVSCAV
jgi:23S rRNA-/tRNA-specific pseudouridylate synthase